MLLATAMYSASTTNVGTFQNQSQLTLEGKA